MAQALASILRSLDATYAPEQNVINKQLQASPTIESSAIAGLDAAKRDSFEQIVTGANRRGVAFGGIPLEEQADYLGTNYLPAVANLKNRFQQDRFNLQQTLAQILQKQRQHAESLYNAELDREAAARASSGGGGGGYSFNTPNTNNTKTNSAPGRIDANNLYGYLATKYKQNPNANRALQDNWVKAWAQANGVSWQNNDTLWSAYNNKYPWAKYSDARFKHN